LKLEDDELFFGAVDVDVVSVGMPEASGDAAEGAGQKFDFAARYRIRKLA
jgi:hypothetical protein